MNANGEGTAICSIKAPTQCIVLTENAGAFGGDTDTWDDGKLQFQGHLGTSNFLFADGHVKSMKPTLTVQGFSSSAEC